MKTEEAAHPAAPSSIQSSFFKQVVKNPIDKKHKWPEGAFHRLLTDMATAATLGCMESHCYAVLAREALRAYRPILSLYRGVFITEGCRLRKVSDALKALETEGLISRDYTRNEKGHLKGPMKIFVKALRGNQTNLHEAHNGHPLGTESTFFMPASEEIRIKEKRERNDAPVLSDWLNYAKSLGWDRQDAENAFNFYEAKGWRLKDGSFITNWMACAKVCMARAKTRLSKQVPLLSRAGMFRGCESPPTYKLMGFESLSDWVDAGSPYPQ